MAADQRYDGSKHQHDRAIQALAGGVSSNFRLGAAPVPLTFTRGLGPRLWDVDNNAYIDYAMGMGPVILGHADPDVTRAVIESLSVGQLFAGQTTEEVALAEDILRIVPHAELVRFGSSGTEVVQAAIRIARAATGRPTIAKFEGHYHGWLDPIFASVAPSTAEAGPAASPVTVPASRGQSTSVQTDVVVLPWNDLVGIDAIVRDRADSIAAIILEPVGCNTGVILPTDGLLAGIRELCTRYGIVMIFDEVITGFRLCLGGAQSLFDLGADLVTFAKALGNGFPIAALAGRKDLLETTTAGVVHGGTYNGNVVSVAAARETLTQLSRPGRYDEMDSVGQELIDGIRQLATQSSLPLHVQGLPTAFNTYFGPGAELAQPRAYFATDRGAQAEFLRLLLDRGVRPTARGTWLLSMKHGRAEVDQTLSSVEDALRVMAESA